jgi:hypothetical protein
MPVEGFAKEINESSSCQARRGTRNHRHAKGVILPRGPLWLAAVAAIILGALRLRGMSGRFQDAARLDAGRLAAEAAAAPF